MIPLSERSQPLGGSTMIAVLFGVVIVACLYVGREVLVPIAVAVLMSFILAPLVDLLQKWYVPRVIAVVFSTLVAFSLVFSVGVLMISQVNQLAVDLPSYQATLRQKIENIRGVAAGAGTLERASEVLKELGKEIDKPTSTPTAVPPGRPDMTSPEKPLLVELRQPDPGALQTLATFIAPLGNPLASIGIVIIFVIFILLQRQDLRGRLVRLVGSRDLQRTTAALDDAGERLSRLFLTQLALNAAFGFVIGAGLWVIGVPNAPLWGVLAMVLRFVPYVGALVAAIFPLVLAAAVGTGWTMVLSTAALFLVVEPLVGHVIEPLVYGRSTGLSPVAVIAAATFWTWLWGPIGLILATPLTICVVVLGRHVDRLKFLDVMLGDRPALTGAELAYQRMLARDPVEAAEQAQAFLKDKPLVAYYDEIVIEALKLAQGDAERGRLDDDSMIGVRDVVVEIVDDLAAHIDVAMAESESHDAHSGLARVEEASQPTAVELPEAPRIETAVVCVPGVGVFDEAIALILTQLLLRRGIASRAEPADALSGSRILDLKAKNLDLVCLCYVEEATPAQIRYTLRRLRRNVPDAHILVSLLGSGRKGGNAAELPDGGNASVVTGTLRETVEAIRALAIASERRQVRPEWTSELPEPAARAGRRSALT
jgi:predicted PurR-regulated permease PerM